MSIAGRAPKVGGVHSAIATAGAAFSAFGTADAQAPGKVVGTLTATVAAGGPVISTGAPLTVSSGDTPSPLTKSQATDQWASIILAGLE